MKAWLYILIFCAFLFPTKYFGQSSEGTDFWLAFMEHRDVGQNAMVLMLSSRYKTSGIVSMPLRSWSTAFSINANEVRVIRMPAYAETLGSENVTTTGIHITSEDPISVYAHQYANLRSEAALILPTESTGTDYYTMGYSGIDFNNEIYPSEFVIVASEDDTNISLTFSDRTKGGFLKGSERIYNLDIGETVQVQSAEGTSGDLSGTRVHGDKPFALFSGAKWTQVPSACDARDNFYEQMYPISTWGKQFAVVPFKDAAYDVVRILASEDETHISVDGQITRTLNRGEFYEYQNRGSVAWIDADHPILVAQYAIGRSCNGINSVGDPSMVLLNAIEQTRDSLTIYSSNFENITRNFINLVIPTANIGDVILDGIPVDATAFTLIPANNAFSYTSLEVESGTHNIFSKGCGMIATAYGYGDIESYAYSGGAAFRPINANPIPEGGCLNDTIFFDTGLPPERASLEWYFGDGTTSNAQTPTHIYTELGIYQTRLVITNYCENRIDTLYQNLEITLRQDLQAGNDTLVCAGEPFSLFASDLSGADYQWKGPNNFFSEEQFPVVLDPTPDATGTYEAIGIISGCATFPKYVQIEVPPLPDPALGIDTTICKEGPIHLYAGKQVSYIWQDGSVEDSLTVTEAGLYWVEVIDQYNCIGSDSIFIEPRCPTEWFIPNAFTPNNDGINDIFQPQGIDFVDYYLKIYNRWGQLVFETRDIQQGWNGKGLSGEDVPEGVYVWMLDAVGQGLYTESYPIRTSGSVTVIR